MTSRRRLALRTIIDDPLGLVPAPSAIIAVSLLLIVAGAAAGVARGSALSGSFILYYAAVASIPVVVVPALAALRTRGRMDAFHPLVYFAWTFFLPNFAIAGLLAAGGLRSEVFSWQLMAPVNGEQVTNPDLVLAASLGVATLGAIGLTVGFFISQTLQGRAKRLRDGESRATRFAALRGRIASFVSGCPRPGAVAILLIAAFAALVISTNYGLFGYRVAPAATPAWVPIVAFFGQWVFLGTALLAGSLATDGRSRAFRVLLAVTVIAALALFALSGSRGFLYRIALVGFAADQYVRARFSLRRLLAWVLAIGLAIGLAMTYGTAYREFRNSAHGRTAQTTVQSETSLATQVARDMANEVTQSVTRTSEQDPGPGAVVPAPEPAPIAVPAAHPPAAVPAAKRPAGILQRGLLQFSERLAGLTDLAIIVKFAEVYQEAEVRRGIDRNIETDFLRSFIPRFLWRDKPVIGPTNEISQLYFGIANHQPAVTYMGDLYRNYELPGVFIGMTLFGALLAAVYGALVVDHPSDPIRSAVWITLLLSFNFESLFSVVVPTLPRTLFVVVLGVFIARIGIRTGTFLEHGTAGGR